MRVKRKRKRSTHNLPGERGLCISPYSTAGFLRRRGHRARPHSPHRRTTVTSAFTVAQPRRPAAHMPTGHSIGTDSRRSNKERQRARSRKTLLPIGAHTCIKTKLAAWHLYMGGGDDDEGSGQGGAQQRHPPPTGGRTHAVKYDGYKRSITYTSFIVSDQSVAIKHLPLGREYGITTVCAAKLDTYWAPALYIITAAHRHPSFFSLRLHNKPAARCL